MINLQDGCEYKVEDSEIKKVVMIQDSRTHNFVGTVHYWDNRPPFVMSTQWNSSGKYGLHSNVVCPEYNVTREWSLHDEECEYVFEDISQLINHASRPVTSIIFAGCEIGQSELLNLADFITYHNNGSFTVKLMNHDIAIKAVADRSIIKLYDSNGLFYDRDTILAGNSASSNVLTLPSGYYNQYGQPITNTIPPSANPWYVTGVPLVSTPTIQEVKAQIIWQKEDDYFKFCEHEYVNISFYDGPMAKYACKKCNKPKE